MTAARQLSICTAAVCLVLLHASKIAAVPSNTTQIAALSAPLNLTATLKGAAAGPAPHSLLSISSSDGLLYLLLNSALSNALATQTVRPNASVSGFMNDVADLLGEQLAQLQARLQQLLVRLRGC